MQRDLVERARTGDHDAFAELAGAAISRLDGAAWLILRDAEQAKDAVQNTLVRAWRDLPTLEGEMQAELDRLAEEEKERVDELKKSLEARVDYLQTASQSAFGDEDHRPSTRKL